MRLLSVFIEATCLMHILTVDDYCVDAVIVRITT